MIIGKDLANSLFNEIIGLKPNRAWLGWGSFITIEFGRDIAEEHRTRRGTEIIYMGEWRLWVYMCKWRIDKDGNPLVGCEDTREKISQCMFELENRVVKKIHVLNDAFDVRFQFGDDIDLYLFSCNTEEDEQWKFFTPGNKVFISGPGASWAYRRSDMVENNE